MSRSHSSVSPTVIPRSLLFPRLLPPAPTPHPIPLPKRQDRRTRFKQYHDLQSQLDSMSDEENELKEMCNNVHYRGYNFLVPMGRTLTQQEEKNDADCEEETEEDDGDGGGNGEGSNDDSESPPSVEEGDEESGQDLDASMEDMDDAENSDDNEDESDVLDLSSDLLA